ncbi:hypothetical protein MIND_01107500 [Mycena indigotica]|uniref:Uncharacterized protein n=1 Tax=Mycena indigotica TaxID=2126181 RepID=A0A8H6SB18_9AGAR|nr:uncharacterized protein MIND_01107500 [Mycena indigotica]KAF7295672.1 hypothetical protein MIND_01107500 [Mycena indigotica]
MESVLTASNPLFLLWLVLTYHETDLNSSNATAAGTLRIWGSKDAITDITKAAGWEILGCDPAALSQDIRLVCTTEDDPNSECGHLYQNIGAVNKLVRLPEACGGSAFARIARAWEPADQSIPSQLQSRLVRRDGTVPVVKALRLDTNFDLVDYSQTGVVNIEISSLAGAEELEARQLKPISGGGVAAPVVSTGGSAAGEIAQPGGSAAGSLEVVAGQAPKDGNVDVIKKAFKLTPLAFNKKVSLVSQTAKCGPATAKLAVDLAANAKADASITVSAKGTVVPPNLSDFALVAGVSANIGGTVTMVAGLSGRMDSGKINLLNQAVTGLNFPGVLTVGPVFRIDAQMVGDVQVPMNMNVGINFAIKNAQLAFPPSAGGKPATSAFSVGDMRPCTLFVLCDETLTPVFPALTINAEAGVKATGTVTAHMIPSLQVAVNALGGQATSQIFIDFDTSASLTMGLDANASAKKTVDVKSAAKSALATKSTASAAKTAATPPAGVVCARQGTKGVTACVLPSKNAAKSAAAKKPAASKAVTAKKAAPKKAATKKTATKAATKKTATKAAATKKTATKKTATKAATKKTATTAKKPATKATAKTGTTAAKKPIKLPVVKKAGVKVQRPVVKKTAAKKPATAAKKPATAAKKPATAAAKKPAVAKKAVATKKARDFELFEEPEYELEAREEEFDEEEIDLDAREEEFDDEELELEAREEEFDDEELELEARAADDAAAKDAKAPKAPEPAAQASFSGCVKVNTGLAINAGASANFFSLFSKSTKANLFTKNFAVLNKCFKKSTVPEPEKTADAAKKAAREIRSYPRTSRFERIQRATLACPVSASPVLKPVTAGTVSSASIV